MLLAKFMVRSFHLVSGVYFNGCAIIRQLCVFEKLFLFIYEFSSYLAKTTGPIPCPCTQK